MKIEVDVPDEHQEYVKGKLAEGAEFQLAFRPHQPFHEVAADIPPMYYVRVGRRA